MHFYVHMGKRDGQNNKIENRGMEGPVITGIHDVFTYTYEWNGTCGGGSICNKASLDWLFFYIVERKYFRNHFL